MKQDASMPPETEHEDELDRPRRWWHPPQKKHLHGTWIHRTVGDRLFHPSLWRFEMQPVAIGAAIGVFVGFTPTYGIQALLSVALAYNYRVHVPTAILGCLVTNPATAPLIYLLEHRVGLELLKFVFGGDEALEGVAGKLRALWTGALVLAVPAAVLTYGLVHYSWDWIAHVEAVERLAAKRAAKKRRRKEAKAAAAAARRDGQGET